MAFSAVCTVMSTVTLGYSPKWPSDNALGVWSVMHNMWTCNCYFQGRACLLQYSCYHCVSWRGLHHGRWTSLRMDGGGEGFQLIKASESPDLFAQRWHSAEMPTGVLWLAWLTMYTAETPVVVLFHITLPLIASLNVYIWLQLILVS